MRVNLMREGVRVGVRVGVGDGVRVRGLGFSSVKDQGPNKGKG